MKNAKSVNLFWKLLVVLFVCNICLFAVKLIRWPFNRGTPEIGNPSYREGAQLIWGEITDYLVYRDHLVLLYDEKRVVQFYSLSGEPEFSYDFKFQNNGGANLYTDGFNLFVEDYRHQYYLFSDKGAFLEYATDEKRKAELSSTFLSTADARSTNDGSIYEFRWASIYKTAAGKSEKIVSRPFFMAIFQGARVGFCIALLFILLGLKYGDFTSKIQSGDGSLIE